MIFFSLFCFPMIYIVLGHWVGMVQTEDAPFPSAAFSNPNFYVSLLVLFGFVILPELLLNSFARRFLTTFHLLAQEVEQLSWFQKQSQEAGDDYSLQPIHKELDKLDKLLWEAETKGVGESEEPHGTGADFSIDDATSLAHGTGFRKRQTRFLQSIPGIVSI